MKNLYLETPLSKAVFELLSQLNDEISGQLKNAGSIGAVKAYIFGGCAVHIYTNARGSSDLDVEIEAAKKLDVHSLIIELDNVYFTDPVLGESQLILDDTFNTAITPVISPDYKERAIPLEVGEQVLHTFLVHPLDIAVSKLSRCATDDVNDILQMFRANRFTLDEFKEAAWEALDYTATPDSLRPNIEHVILQLNSD